MLDSIHIQNFKAIQGEKGLTLKNLTKVNYLVGQNGSGKSSILEALHSQSLLISDLNGNLLREFKKIQRKIGNEDFIINYVAKGFCPSQVLQNLFFLKTNDSYSRFTNILDSSNKPLDWHERADFFGKIFLKFRFAYLDMDEFWSNTIPHKGFNKLNTFLINSWDEFLKYMKQINEKEWTTLSKVGPWGIRDNNLNTSSGLIQMSSLLFAITRLNLHIENNKLILIDEVEAHLHPKWAKHIPKLLDIFSDVLRVQFIVSTHSPFIINAALELDDQKVYSLDENANVLPDSDGIDKKRLAELGKINQIYGIHSNLGMYPSDLLFSNTIIFVEGPSDAIYIEFWLRKYIEENGQKAVKKGQDYDFALFGGACAENFYLLEDDYVWNPKKDEQNEVQIFNLLKTHPKSFIVVDNDGGILKKGEKSRKKGNSKFEKFKQKVIDNFDENSFWYDENPDNFTIECYRKGIKFKKEKSKKELIKDTKSQTKKDFALSYCKNNVDKKFSEITKEDCAKMIEKIYSFITSSN